MSAILLTVRILSLQILFWVKIGLSKIHGSLILHANRSSLCVEKILPHWCVVNLIDWMPLQICRLVIQYYNHINCAVSCAKATSIWCMLLLPNSMTTLIRKTLVTLPSDVPTSVSPAQEDGKTVYSDILEDYKVVFSAPTELPPERPVSNTIPLEDPQALPPFKHVYKLSKPEQAKCMEQIKALLEKGHLLPSSSPYGAPILFDQK